MFRKKTSQSYLLMKQYLKCGIIKKRRDGLYSLDVTTPKDLYFIIIPFFDKYPLFTKNKAINFQLFTKAVELMFLKQHLTSKGLSELIEIRKKINEGKAEKENTQNKTCC